MQGFVEKMIKTLTEDQVEYIIVGGLSAVLHGVPVVTQDLDICYRRTPENMAKLANALLKWNPRLRGLPPDVPNVFDQRSLEMGMNFTLEIDDEAIDLLGEMSAIGGYEKVILRAEEMQVAGYTVKVLSIEDLIETKRAAGRAKDLAVMPLLEATLKLKQQEKEQGTNQFES